MDQHIGTRLGNYQIVQVIAKGSYGIVYRAKHLHLDSFAAIKLINAGLNTPQQQEFFLQEAKTLANLEHPNIVRLLDYGIEEGNPYLISEYAPGGSLRGYLQQQASQPLPLRTALSILAQVGRALIYVHSQGTIHRDLKPENILFGKNNKVLLADFGIARVKQVTGAASRGNVGSLMGFGTPAYMAPEQFKAKGKPLPESDQYALGCIAYELLTGQLPFTPDDERAYGYQHVFEPPDPPRLLNPTLPPRVEQAILTALAKDPAKRHASVETFLVALGIRLSVPTQVGLTSDATVVARDPRIEGSDDPTLIRQSGKTLTEGEIATELSPRRSVSTRQFDSTVLQPTVPAHPTPMQTLTHPTSPPFQTAGPTRQTPHSATSTKGVAARQTFLLWTRVQSTIRGASALIVAKWLFLLAALLDIPLLLSGFWFGPSFFTQAGTILAVGICICGLALNFFLEPWIWLVLFLLLSPLSGGLYAFFVTAFHIDNSIINWHTYSAYFLLTPLAGILYGLFGPARQRDESMNPSFTKRLILTIWFLGAGLFVFGFGAPMITYIGLAWALASGILAAAQLIRLKQWEWLIYPAVFSAMTAGAALFFCGFAYGAFGPTAEG